MIIALATVANCFKGQLQNLQRYLLLDSFSTFFSSMAFNIGTTSFGHTGISLSCLLLVLVTGGRYLMIAELVVDWYS